MSDNPLTDPLTQSGGAFSGKPAGPTIPAGQPITGNPPFSTAGMPQWEADLYNELYQADPPFEPDPIVAALPQLTPAMINPMGPLAQFAPSYVWATQVRDVVNRFFTNGDNLPSGIKELQILMGDDSSPLVVNLPPTQRPGIYDPTMAPNGTRWVKKGSDGQTYYYLEFRCLVTPNSGTPYVTEGFNVVSLVRELINGEDTADTFEGFATSAVSSTHVI